MEPEIAAREGAPGRATPAIFMYHSISPCEDDPYDITIRPERFERQMRYLHRAGRTGTSVGQLLDAHRRGSASGLVGLSFDDGYRDFSEHALPVLQRYGFGATMFVPAGLLGKDNSWDPEGPRKALLSPEDLRQVAAAGVEIGSHGFRHVSLPTRSDADLDREIRESRDILREVSGHEVRGFSYPHGQLDERVMDYVRNAGYSYACAVWETEFAGRYALSRDYIRNTDSPRALWAKDARRWLKQGYRGPGSQALRAMAR
jgi:peptidoglycan/xylan/chitin deacetylase (PgdA/CDA1 family)